MNNLDVRGAIAREWLLDHLNEVDMLVGDLISRLENVALTPEKHDWEPLAGRDADENHMLRRHLKSRALWVHHGGVGKALTSMAPVHRQMVRPKHSWHPSELYRNQDAIRPAAVCYFLRSPDRIDLAPRRLDWLPESRVAAS